jgi:Fe-S oxidoreductase
VFAQVGVTCVGGDKRRCCGAPDLYNGNISRFRRTLAKNVRIFRNSVQQGRPIVVGQNRCLEVMRDHYGAFSNDPDICDLVTQLFGASEFLCQIPAPDDVIDVDKSQSPHLLTLLHSDVSAHTGTQHVTADVLRKWGYKVDVVEHLPVAETVWEIHKGRTNLISRARQDLEAMLDATGAADIVSESCATNLLLRQGTHREIRHPMEVLADLMSASKPPAPQ